MYLQSIKQFSTVRWWCRHDDDNDDDNDDNDDDDTNILAAAAVAESSVELRAWSLLYRLCCHRCVQLETSSSFAARFSSSLASSAFRSTSHFCCSVYLQFIPLLLSDVTNFSFFRWISLISQIVTQFIKICLPYVQKYHYYFVIYYITDWQTFLHWQTVCSS